MPNSQAKFHDYVSTRTQEQSPPEILYKYMTCDTARKVLYHRTLRFNSPLQFNDPFDSQWNVYWPLATREARDGQYRILDRAIRNPASWPPAISANSAEMLRNFRQTLLNASNEEYRRALDRMLSHTFSPENLEKMISAPREAVTRRSRVLCLTENPCSTLMWSHYAASHRGVVVAIRSSVIEDSIGIPIQPVRYVHKLPALIDTEAQFESVLFGTGPIPLLGRPQEWALIKHKHWEYEAEWRSASVTENENWDFYTDQPLQPEALMEIVAGYRSDSSEVDYLVHLARKINPNIKVFKMSPHLSEFELLKEACNPSSES